MALKIQLFGGLRVWREGEASPICSREWRDRKTLQIFKILVSERGRIFYSDELIEWLWPHCAPTKAAASLRNRISHLRRVLEPSLQWGSRSHYIRTCFQGYCFDAKADCEIDSELFRKAYATGQALKHAGRWKEAIACYEQAEALYQGDYLAEDRYESWALAHQERWRRVYWDLLVRLAQCYAHTTLYEKAIAKIEKVIELAPTWSEAIYRQLMDYYAQLGDRMGVMRTYARLKRMLSECFAVDPSPQTQQLLEELQHRDGAPYQTLLK